MNYFRIDYFFDPFGDGKSEKKLHRRVRYFSGKSINELNDLVINFNRDRSYYGKVAIHFRSNRYRYAKEFRYL
jgi:transposase